MLTPLTKTIKSKANSLHLFPKFYYFFLKNLDSTICNDAINKYAVENEWIKMVNERGEKLQMVEEGWKRKYEIMSHPGSRKQNRSLHTCAQDVQITRTANNMVNRYNISWNYKLESLQNNLWVQKKYYRVARKSKCRFVFYRHNRRRGRPSLYLLAPAGTLGWTPAFCST
jgi:hypothetical protein